MKIGVLGKISKIKTPEEIEEFCCFLKEGDNIDACQKLLDITFSLVHI